jgi:hypothetical protein
MSTLGLAEYAPDRTALGPALARTLAAGRRPRLDVVALADPAEAIVLLAERARRQVRS